MFFEFKSGFEDFTRYVTNVVNFALLLIVYIVGIGVTSIIAKILGKHFLNIKKRKRSTYWQDYGLSKEPEDNYYRPF